MSGDSITRVLVACDFSDAAKRAVGWTANLQSRVGGLDVVVAFVWDTTPEVMAALPAASGPTDEDLRTIERELRTVCDEHRLAARIAVEVASDPGAAIVRKAEELGSDLLVLGTHGRSGVARAVLGSVADWVVRKAPCPVVVTRAAPQA